MKNNNTVAVNINSFQSLDDSRLFEIYGMAAFVLNGRVAERALSANVPSTVAETEDIKPEKTKTTKKTKSENKVSEPTQTADSKESGECEHFLREGRIVYKSPCHLIDKSARGGIRHTAIELGGTILKSGSKKFDSYHAGDIYTIVIEFKKVADAKAFLASQSKYHFKKCEPVPESAK